MERVGNIFYFFNINSIGGIETFFFNLAKKYQDWDIVIFYQQGDENQIRRLREFVEVRKWKGERIKCQKAFFNFNLDIIDYVDAEEYIQIAHGDYKAMGVRPNTHPKITKYLGVSQQVCDTFEEVTGYPTELAYNPIDVRKPKKILHLISATRLTKEKGKNRIRMLASILDSEKIPYTWTIFTDDVLAINNPSIVYRRPTLDIIDQIADSDYLVQLSDNEGYCYSVVEALCLGVPVIVTDCPVFREIGVVNGKNGFILDFDLIDVPAKRIHKGLPKFEYSPPADRWDEILAKGESQYKKKLKQQVQITVVKEYYDLQLDKMCLIGDVLTVSRVRADYIIESGYAEMRGE